MTLLDFQKLFVTALNGDGQLIEGGCKAVAEDSLDISADLNKQLLTLKGIALVVMTPSVKPLGSISGGFIPVQIPELTISCVERPALNRSRAGAMTALSAAQRVIALLSSQSVCFMGLAQTGDETTGSLAANVIFSTTTMLTTN